MTSKDRQTRTDEWCLDDPTYNVCYGLDLRVETISDAPIVLVNHRGIHILHTSESSDGSIELFTRNTLEPLVEATHGTRVFMNVRAFVTLANKDIQVQRLIEGQFDVPETVSDIGGNAPGFFFVIDGGFALFIHVDANKTPIHIAICGKMAHLEHENY
jgi:hypothetical protein